MRLPALSRVLLALAAAAALASPAAQAAPGDIDTVAGNGSFASTGDGGPATAAGTGSVEGVFFSPGGFHLTEDAGPRVRFVDLGGTISTAAGGGSADPGDGGPATAALLQDPEQVIRDRSGNVYFTSGDRVRRISPLGLISTVAGTGVGGFSGDGGPATAAQLLRPHGLALDLDGNLYVGDCDNNRIRRVAPLGVIDTVAGTGAAGYTGDGGPATAAALDCPVDVAVDSAGRLVIADNDNNAVRLVGTDGTIATVAGTGVAGYSGDGGPALSARMRQPQGVDVDGNGALYVAEAYNHVIRRIDPNGTISTVAGTGAGAGSVQSNLFSGDGGPATAATLNGPREVSFDSDTGDLYIADRFNNRVRRVEALGAPIPLPAATITSSPASPGSDSTPTWAFSSSESGEVRYECRLTRGAATVSDWSPCSSPATYDISGQPDGSYTFAVRATNLAGTGAPASSSYAFERFDHFEIDPISRQSSGVPFSMTVRAKTASGATDTSFNGTADLSVNSGSVSPVSSGSFASGVLTRNVTITGPFNAAQTLTASHPGGTGTSAPFVLSDNKYYFKQTTAQTGTRCAGAFAQRDMEEGYAGQDPEETHRRYSGGAETISFCSPPFAAAQSLPQGAATVRAYVNSNHGSSCDISATLLVNGTTSLGSTTRTISPFASLASVSWTINLSATTIAAGDKLSVRLQMAPVKACSQTYIHYGGTVNRSHLELLRSSPPTITSGPGSTGSSRTPTWQFSGEAGAAFECRLEDGTAAPVPGYFWSGCTSPRTFDLSGLPDGGYAFAVRQIPSGGTTSPAARSDYVLDTAAPQAPTIDSSPPSPSSSTTPTWSFSGEDGATFECRLLKNASVVIGYASCSGSRTYSLTAGDGTYTFETRQTDAAGNLGPSVARDYVLDTVAPAAPSFMSAPSSPGNDTTPTWTVAGESGSLLECRVERASGAVVSGWTGCTSPYTYDLGSQPDGSYTLLVRQTDSAQNMSPAASSTYVLDTAPAAAPTIAGGPADGNDPTPTWTLSGEAGATFECRLTRGAATVSDWATCTSPKTYDLSAEPDGAYTFSARQTDSAGNQGPAATDTYRLDRATPGAPTNDSMPPSPSPSASPEWSFSGEAGAALECRLAGLTTVVSDWSPCSSPESFDLSGQPDGSYTFSVRQTDAAGNTSSAANAWYTLDTAAPPAPDIDPRPSSPRSAAEVEWGFTAESGAATECRLVRGATIVSGWSVCTSPRSYDLAAEPDGTYTFSVRATDSAGQTGPAASDDVELDRAAPAAPALTATPGGLGNDATPTWDFTTDSGSASECRLDRGATTVSDWQACAGSVTYDLSGAPDGGYRFRARSTDGAGNLGPETASDYELDRAAPAAPAIGSGQGSTGSSRTPEWEFTGEAGAVHECRFSRPGTVLADWAPCASPVAHDLAGEPDDTYTFEVRSTDGAANTGAAASSAYRLDTVGADPTIERGPGPVGRDGAPSWSFSGEPSARFECTLEREGAPLAGWDACTSPYSFDLGSEPDGAYTFRVRARDEADNLGAPVSYDYLLDRAAPAPPEFTDSPGELGNDATPRWALRAEPGTVMECSLVREGAGGDWMACAGEVTRDLAPSGDGSYALAARTTDAAGNTSAVSESAYRLDATAPGAPEITDDPGPEGRGRQVSWAFRGEPAASFQCRLTQGATVLDEWSPCDTRARYDLSGARPGEIAFRVRSRDRAGNLGPAARSAYELLPPAEEERDPPAREPRAEDPEPAPAERAPAPEESPADPVTGPSQEAPTAGSSSSPASPREDPPAAEESRDRDRSSGPGASIPLGDDDPPAGDTAPAPSTADGGDTLGERLFGTLGDAARWAVRNADKTGFPLLLLLVVMGYSVVQSRLDGRDPKLALAPVHADRDLEFVPPGSMH